MLYFTLGAERLRRQGIDVRIVTVTDDIASAPIDQQELRRGIAGGLAVYKVAGAGAEAGLPLDEVERLARKANGRTRTLGVAFSGCTLPGADQPLFEVASGRMAIGMGLHGEPGLSEGPLTEASTLAALLVERLLGLWVIGATGQPTPTLWYWAPTLVGTLLWPWVYIVLRDVRRRFKVT